MWRKHRISLSLATVLGTVILLLVGAACGDGDEEGNGNRAPEIVSGISVPTGSIRAGSTIEVRVISVTDPDGDPVTYTWSARLGTVDPVGPTEQPTTTYTAPDFAGDDSITVTVSDGKGGTTTASIEFPVVVAAEGTPTPPEQVSAIEITSPEDGSEVEHTTQVRGTSSNVPNDQDIWLIVQPHLAPQFHLQPGPVARRQDGEWTGSVFFGESPSRQIGEGFELIVVVATREASQAFLDYLDQSSSAGSFPGLAFLPEGVEVKDQITVTRR